LIGLEPQKIVSGTKIHQWWRASSNQEIFNWVSKFYYVYFSSIVPIELVEKYVVEVGFGYNAFKVFETLKV